MSTRHGYRTCKNCGELPILQFTPELRAECRACYNSKRRQQNSLGSQQLKQGTWIESSVLSSLYQEIQTLQTQISTLTTERSMVDQQLSAEISAKEQGLARNIQLDQEMVVLKAQISILNFERPVIDQLEPQITETTQRLTTLETLTRETQTQMTQLLGLISAPSNELSRGEKISKQLSTLSHLILDRPLIDQVRNLMTEQFGAFQSQLTSQSAEIGHLQELINVKEARLSDRLLTDQLEQKIEEPLQARDLQLAELLSQLKLQSDQISSLINGRPLTDQKAPNSRFRTPPRRISPPEDPMSAEPSTLTVHPEPTSGPRPDSSDARGPVIAKKMDQLQVQGDIRGADVGPEAPRGWPLSMPAGPPFASSGDPDPARSPRHSNGSTKRSPPPFVRPPPPKK